MLDTLLNQYRFLTRQPINRADAEFEDQPYLCLASLTCQVTGITVQVQLLDIPSTAAIMNLELHANAIFSKLAVMRSSVSAWQTVSKEHRQHIT